jgi:hypothetical protein
MTFNLPEGAGNYVWQQVSVDKMVLDTSGNLGIGTSAPSYKIDVRGGSISAGNGTIFGGISYSSRTEIGSISNHSVGFMTNSTTQMLLDTSGNLGIGTTAPAVRLDVSGGAIRGQALDATGTPALFTSTGGGVLYHNGSGAAVLRAYANGSGTAGELIFNTNAAERMRIDSSGDVGVGTTAPTTGSMSNLATLNAGIFITHRGSVSATTAVATTIAVGAGANNVTYIVSCGVAAGDPVNYSAVAIVSGDAGTFRVTALQTAALMAISVSGTNIQATQTSGGTQPIQFCITRVS